MNRMRLLARPSSGDFVGPPSPQGGKGSELPLMRILLLCHSFNSLTQRLHVALREAGHEVGVEFDVNDAVTHEAVALFRPDVVLAPFLKRAIPEDVWRSVRSLINPSRRARRQRTRGTRLGGPRTRTDLGRDAARARGRDGRRSGMGLARVSDAPGDQGEPLPPRSCGSALACVFEALGELRRRDAAAGARQRRPWPPAAGLRRGAASNRSCPLHGRGGARRRPPPPDGAPVRC